MYPRGVGFGLDRRARSRKAKGGVRALFGKAPDAGEVGDRLARLARRLLRERVLDASSKRVTLALNAHAPPARIVVLPDGDLEITAETAMLGPGYHGEVLSRLAPILDELDYVWIDAPHDAVAEHAAWLAGELRKPGQARIGMPSGRTFKIDAPVLTALGPRDATWREAVLADPMRGADAFPWWETGPGREARANALLAMWHEVPWREPLDEAERTMMEQVDADLRAARRADPEIKLPWPEWAVLLDLLELEGPLLAKIRARAGTTPPTIGYRRYPMEVELSGEWQVELPGSFVGSWDQREERYVATDGERTFEFTSLTAGGEEDSARLLAVAPAKHTVIAGLIEPGRHGRAEAHDEAGRRVVHGLMAAAPHVAIITCRGDEAWGVATWRSLKRS